MFDGYGCVVWFVFYVDYFDFCYFFAVGTLHDEFFFAIKEYVKGVCFLAVFAGYLPIDCSFVDDVWLCHVFTFFLFFFLL